jgi:membrane protein
MRKFIEVLKQTFKEYSEDKISRHAAALAYFTIFSIAPVLVIIISVAGLVLGEQAVQNEIAGQIEGLVGAESAAMIQSMIASASDTGSSTLATIVGVAVLVFAATGLFVQLQDSLNTIWEIKSAPEGGITKFITKRIFSFTMILGIAFLLLVSLVISAALAAVTRYFEGLLPGSDILWLVLNYVITFGVITLLFALIFKILPDAKIAWSDVWLGAAVTAFLFMIGQLAIGLYLGRSSVSSSYGAAGSLVVILLWIYYSAQILFIGAEFTQVQAKISGTGIEPEEGAIKMTEEDRIHQGLGRRDQAARQAAFTAGRGTILTQPIPATGMDEELPSETVVNPLRQFRGPRKVQQREPHPTDKSIRALGAISAGLVVSVIGLVFTGMKRR